MLNLTSKYICRHRLLTAGERVLVALSGGADSVALLLVLKDLGYECVAAHCNFQLRGEESDRDEAFVRSLTGREGVALHVTTWDTAAIARQRGVSVEMAARDLRYKWFAQVAKEEGIRSLCTGHHADDNAETFFLNLTRGTGVAGLAGMQPLSVRDGLRIVRPLLECKRQDIETFLERRGQAYVTDSTNADTAYRRNLIRHELLPILRRINPSFDKSLTHTMQRMGEARRVLEMQTNEEMGSLCSVLPDGLRINADGLRQSAVAGNVLYHIARQFGFPPSVAEDIFSHLAEEGGGLYENGTYTLTRNRDAIEVRRTPRPFAAVILREGENLLPDGTRIKVEASSDTAIVRDRSVACLDADKLMLPLTCRTVLRGDRFAPFGMYGTKLISDFLSDRGYSRISRMGAKVVLSGNDIAWVVGERPARRYAVTSATRQLLRLSYYEE